MNSLIDVFIFGAEACFIASMIFIKSLNVGSVSNALLIESINLFHSLSTDGRVPSDGCGFGCSCAGGGV